MARSGSFSSLGTTRTAYFRSNADFASGNNPTASSGIDTGGDGVYTKGFRVRAATGNATNVLVYVNGQLAGTLSAEQTHEFVTIANDGSPSGSRLELAAESGTVSGTFGTLS